MVGKPCMQTVEIVLIKMTLGIPATHLKHMVSFLCFANFTHLSQVIRTVRSKAPAPPHNSPRSCRTFALEVSSLYHTIQLLPKIAPNSYQSSLWSQLEKGTFQNIDCVHEAGQMAQQSIALAALTEDQV